MRFYILALALFTWSAALAAESPLNTSLKPSDQVEEVSGVFRDMGVVQRRAMVKGGRILLSSYGTFDFSDGPYTNYSLNVNPGFALSDFLEVYVNWVPKFFVSPRSIVALVEKSGSSIVAAKPVSQIGMELLWAPAYGKDSLGIHKVIRSDTFFKLGIGQTTYDSDSGMRFVAGLGKTFFLGSSVGFRICVDFGYLQSTINGEKLYRGMALMESGLTLYL